MAYRSRKEENERKRKAREERFRKENEANKNRSEKAERERKRKIERVLKHLLDNALPDMEPLDGCYPNHRTFALLGRGKQCFWNPRYWFLLSIGHIFGNVRVTYDSETQDVWVNMSDAFGVSCVKSSKANFYRLNMGEYRVSKIVPFADCKTPNPNSITVESLRDFFEELGRDELVLWMDKEVLPRIEYFRRTGKITWHRDFTITEYSQKTAKVVRKIPATFVNSNLFRPSAKVLMAYEERGGEPVQTPRKEKKPIPDCDVCLYKLDWMARHPGEDADAAHAPTDGPSPVGGPGEETDPEKIAALLGEYDTNDADHADWVPETDIYEIKFKDGRKVRINAPKKEKAEPAQESGKEAAPDSVPVTEYETEESAIEGPRPSSDGSPKETAPVIGVIQSVQTLIVNNYYGKVEGK